MQQVKDPVGSIPGPGTLARPRLGQKIKGGGECKN